MAEEKFKLRLDLKTGDPNIDNYIYELHNYLITFETSSIKSLIVALDRLAHELCDDIDNIVEGVNSEDEVSIGEDGVELKKVPAKKILTDSVYDKTFDRIMALIKNIKDFKAISEMAESLRPEIAERKEQVKKSKPVIEIDVSGNAFEQLQKEKLSKLKK